MYQLYPANCQPKNDAGVQRCTVTVGNPSDRQAKQADSNYAYLWTDRSIDKEGLLTYKYEGMSWPQVCITSLQIVSIH